MDGPVVPPNDSPPPLEELTEAGRYRRFSVAQEHGLVAAALDLPYWVVRDGREFVLYVEPAGHETLLRELAKFDAELAERMQARTAAETSLPKLDTLPLFAAAWVMCSFWAAQNYAPESWVDRGDASNRAIFAGEWWRTLTALTLHGDLPHFVANLSFGLLFAGFVLPRFGAGITWLGFVLAGAVGNALNAAFYHAEPHSTIGASTAVFGSLGMLVAWELAERWRAPERRGWWHLVVPLGGGLALLAYLGVGDEEQRRVDYMAHFWGFTAGMFLGVTATLLRVSRRMQWAAALLALLLPLLAWLLAIESGR